MTEPRHVTVVITEDRHAEPEADVFASQEGAMKYAESYAQSVDADREELNDAMIRSGWLGYWTYGESSFWVIRKEVKP